MADLICTLSLEDGWPCEAYRAGKDGKCQTCRHLKTCHDLTPRDPPWRQG